MEVVTVETSAFKAIEGMVNNILNMVTTQAEEIKHLKDNRLMSIPEVMEYTGFGKSWLMEHKNEIGYMQIGSSPLRFYKEDIDKYFLQHKIQKKYK